MWMTKVITFPDLLMMCWCSAPFRSPTLAPGLGLVVSLSHGLWFFSLHSLNTFGYKPGIGYMFRLLWTHTFSQSFNEIVFPFILWPSPCLRALTHVSDVGRVGRKWREKTVQAGSHPDSSSWGLTCAPSNSPSYSELFSVSRSWPNTSEFSEE